MRCVPLNAPGAEGEAGETAGCPRRPVQSQGGKTQRAAEAQRGGARKEEERGGGGGSQVNSLFLAAQSGEYSLKSQFKSQCHSAAAIITVLYSNFSQLS